MNEDKLNTLRQQDANLRDAIRQDEMERPQMPADLNARLMQRVMQEPRKANVHRIWPWLAAACVAAFIVVYVTPPKNATGDGTDGQQAIAEVVEHKEVKSVDPKVEEPRVEEPHKMDVPKADPIKVKPQKFRQRPVAEKTLLAQQKTPAESVHTVVNEPDLAQADAPKAEPKMTTITERDIPITRPENYKYTPEEIALMKKQANEAYLKWAQLELEIAKHNLEQTAQK